jgi:uncharacterized protein YqjF (DUF2071 family)
MADHDFRWAILDELSHRPWPRPDTAWVMTQTWHELLFAHWRVDPAMLRARVPAPFELDLFDSEAWLGIVPFHMTNVAPRGVPSLPWISAFPELNVRTYVRVGERPGIYFFSLDAGSTLAVQTARALLNLPYYAASMTVSAAPAGIRYESERSGAPEAGLSAIYRPAGPVRRAVRGTLEYFLTERYCLYNLHHNGQPYRLEIHHPPWPLQDAEAAIERNTMAQVAGLVVDDAAPLLHYAHRQDMVAWAPANL